MPRRPRLDVPGVAQHLVQRGNNRNVCFFSDQDYPVYLDKLRIYAKTHGVKVHAFVLMTNHIHLLVTPTKTKAISLMMQALGRDYVMYVNRNYDRTGSLWDGRFKSSVIDSERYFLTVCRYIELNPVRANMVEHPAEYLWSSYKGNALGIPIKLISHHDIYQNLGRTSLERQYQYRQLFKQIIPQNTLENIRSATASKLVLGDNRFKAEIEQQLNRHAFPANHGGDRKSNRFKQNQVL